jgi:hypothetical protein
MRRSTGLSVGDTVGAIDVVGNKDGIADGIADGTKEAICDGKGEGSIENVGENDSLGE